MSGDGMSGGSSGGSGGRNRVPPTCPQCGEQTPLEPFTSKHNENRWHIIYLAWICVPTLLVSCTSD